MTAPTYFDKEETLELLKDKRVCEFAKAAFPEAEKAIMVWSSDAKDRHRMASKRLSQQRAAVINAGTPAKMRSRVLHLIRCCFVDVHFSSLNYKEIREKIGVTTKG